MSRNMEIKTRIESVASLAARAAAIATAGPIEIFQDDTFFACNGGRTRIHLDRVRGLGEFLELEVVLRDGESAELGVQEAHELMALLGVGDSQLIEGAYVDLLAP